MFTGTLCLRIETRFCFINYGERNQFNFSHVSSLATPPPLCLLHLPLAICVQTPSPIPFSHDLLLLSPFFVPPSSYLFPHSLLLILESWILLAAIRSLSAVSLPIFSLFPVSLFCFPLTLSLPPSLPPSPSLPLPLSLPPSLSLLLSPSFSLPPSPSLSLPIPPYPSLSLPLPPSLSFSLPPTPSPFPFPFTASFISPVYFSSVAQLSHSPPISPFSISYPLFHL